jgi:hypothetical protein
MTFDELVRKVAEKNSMVFKSKGATAADHGKTLKKTEAIIRDALQIARDAALAGDEIAPVFPGIGRFVAVAVRSTGRNRTARRGGQTRPREVAPKASIHPAARAPTARAASGQRDGVGGLDSGRCLRSGRRLKHR